MVQELLLLLSQRLVSRDQVDLSRATDLGTENDLVPDHSRQYERHAEIRLEEVVRTQGCATNRVQSVREQTDQDQKRANTQEDGSNGPEASPVCVFAFEDGALLCADGRVEPDAADCQDDPGDHEDGRRDAGEPVLTVSQVVLEGSRGE